MGLVVPGMLHRVGIHLWLGRRDSNNIICIHSINIIINSCIGDGLEQWVAFCILRWHTGMEVHFGLMVWLD